MWPHSDHTNTIYLTRISGENQTKMTIRTIALAVVVISLLITPAFVQAAVVADGLIVKQPVNADKTQVKADAVVDTAKRPIVVEEEVMAAPAAIPAAVPAAVAAVAAAPAAPPAIPVVPAAVAPVESVVTASDKAKPEPIPEVNIGHKSSDNTGDELPASLTTGFYIIVAGGFVAAAYITFRAFR